MKNIYNNIKVTGRNLLAAGFLVAGLTGVPEKAAAQINPLGQTYFQNQYLANPAMAGLQNGAQINLAYRKQWTNMPDAPMAQSFTAQYGIGGKIGLGVNFFNDDAGVLRKTKAMGTVAYHLPLGSENHSLSLGVSAGVNDQSIKTDNPEEMGDASVTKFNDRGAQFDGDIGLAYIFKGLNIQASLPNVLSYNDKYTTENLVNRPVFFSSISYKTKINLSADVNPLGVEPKLVFRDIDGFKDMVDVGANFTAMEDKLSVLTMYHSTQNFTFGLGYKYKTLALNAMHTTKAHDLQQFQNSNFEVGLQFSFGDTK